MSVEWYCRLMGAEMGPYTSSQLIEMARSHQLTPEDYVKKGADGNWTYAHRVKGLFEDAASSSIIMASLPPELSKLAPREKSPPEEAPADRQSQVTWHYISNHTKVGPLSFTELVAHGKQGLLKPSDRVWSSSSPKWCDAQKVKGLVFDQAREEG